MGAFSLRRIDDDVAVVSLLGEHDLASRDELEELLRRVVAERRLVVVDVTPAAFIDSSVLNGLVLADELLRARGGRLALRVGTAAVVARALEVSGLLGTIPHAGSEGEAVALARAHAPSSSRARARTPRPTCPDRR